PSGSAFCRVGLAGTALLLAAGDLGGQRVEALLPQSAEAAQPLVDLAQRRRVDGVQPPGALGADGGEAVLAQHFQVLGDGGLGDAVLALDDGGDRAGAQLAVGEELQDPAPDGVAEDVERVHAPSVSADPYISQNE